MAKTVTYSYDPNTAYEMTTGLDRTGMSETQFATVDQTTAKTGAITSIPAGAPASSSITTYLNDQSYHDRNILGLVTSVVLQDAAANTGNLAFARSSNALYDWVLHARSETWRHEVIHVPSSPQHWRISTGRRLRRHRTWVRACSPRSVA